MSLRLGANPSFLAVSHKPSGRLPLLSARFFSQPKSITVPWPITNYTVWWQRHIGVSSLPKDSMRWCPARTWTCNLWITSPTPYRYCHCLTPLVITCDYKTLTSLRLSDGFDVCLFLSFRCILCSSWHVCLSCASICCRSTTCRLNCYASRTLLQLLRGWRFKIQSSSEQLLADCAATCWLSEVK